MAGSSSMMPAQKEARERIRRNNALYFLKNDISEALRILHSLLPENWRVWYHNY
jgi:uncharacterized membrane protein YccC